jgi:hypothetical protein
MGCHPAGSERIPAPKPGEAVVFYDHFPRGFVLRASSFMREFLDHFHLQPHHLGANAMMTLAAFAALCEAYLGIWPNVELFCRLIYLKTQTAETIPVICGTASFYARKTADFPSIKGKESCKKWQCSFFYVKNLKEGADHINLPPFDASGPGEDSSADFHYANGGRPRAGRPPARLCGCPRVATPAPFAQDLLPGIR